MSSHNKLYYVNKTELIAAKAWKKYLPRKLKVALYSHDTMGLGHMRRNILISHALACSEFRAAIMLIAGSHEAGYFSMPEGVDCLTLPALRKEVEDGKYHSRRLGVPLQDLTNIRARTICAALEAFKPDVLIIDKEPLGANGELELSLNRLHKNGHTHFVLGLRDVLDEPVSANGKIKCESCARKEENIRQYYDAVWIYGDPVVYDLVEECGFSPDITAKVRYTGYLDQNAWLKFFREKESIIARDIYSYNNSIVCMVGGGQDGANIALTFAKATLPTDTHGIIVTGPFMLTQVRHSLKTLTSTRRNMHVVEFLPDSVLLSKNASKIISMGGYNTICEVLSFDKEALIIPRVIPRLEQFIRAKRLKDLGLISMLHPDDLNPDALTHWMESSPQKNSSAHNKMDLNGIDRLPWLLYELLNNSNILTREKAQAVGDITCQ